MRKYLLFIEIETDVGRLWLKEFIEAPNRRLANDLASAYLEYLYNPLSFCVTDFFVGGVVR